MKNLTKLATLLIGMLFLGGALAGGTVADAEQLVKDTTKQIVGQIKSDKAKIKENPDHLIELVNTIVIPHFDFRKMSAWVLGKYWRKANDKQKERFTDEFRLLLVRTYSKALEDSVDKKIDFLATRAKKSGDVLVRTEVEQDGALPLGINYKLHLKDGAWKVYDVIIEDVSLVANYRTSFGKKAKTDGIDKLIESLVERNKSKADDKKA